VLTQRLAQKLLDRLSGMQRSGQLPDKETCDVLILDRYWVGGDSTQLNPYLACVEEHT
jgi:hypothetical protein